MQRLKRIYGYLNKFKDSAIRIRTGYLDYSSIENKSYEWKQAVYGNVEKSLPDDLPFPLGKEIMFTS